MASLVELIRLLRDEQAENPTFVDLLIRDMDAELQELLLPPETVELFLSPNLESPERVNWLKEGF